MRKPVSEPMEKFDVKRFVLLAVVAKNEVVVAAVPVAFTKVKFWRVEEPVVRRFESVERPFVAVSVPATERLPALSKVLVAVPPKYAVSKTEKRVVDAWIKELAVVEVAVR